MLESSKIIMVSKWTKCDEVYTYKTAETLQSTDTGPSKATGETDTLPTKGRDQALRGLSPAGEARG